MNVLDYIKKFFNQLRHKQPRLPETTHTVSNDNYKPLKSRKNDFVNSLHYEVPTQNKNISRQANRSFTKNRTITRPKTSDIKKNFSSAALAALLAASIAPAAVTLTGCDSSKSNESFIEQIENSDNPQSRLEAFGINESDFNSLTNLADNVNEENLEESVDKFRDLKLNIGKSKISDALGVNSSDITFGYEKNHRMIDDVTCPVVKVANLDGSESVYSEANGNLSQDISSYIISLDYTNIETVDGFNTALKTFEDDFMSKDIILDENNTLQANDHQEYIQVTMEEDEELDR